MRRINPNDNTPYARVPREDEGDGPWEVCARCGFPAPLHSFKKTWCPDTPDEQEWLCALCANTIQPGSRFDFPERRFASTMCFIGNALLNAMGAFEEIP